MPVSPNLEQIWGVAVATRASHSSPGAIGMSCTARLSISGRKSWADISRRIYTEMRLLRRTLVTAKRFRFSSPVRLLGRKFRRERHLDAEETPRQRRRNSYVNVKKVIKLSRDLSRHGRFREVKIDVILPSLRFKADRSTINWQICYRFILLSVYVIIFTHRKIINFW